MSKDDDKKIGNKLNTKNVYGRDLVEYVDLTGPWDAKLSEYIKSFPLVVTVFDKKDKIIVEKCIDYSVREHRIWIGKITIWAVNLGYVVETASR